MTKQKTLTEEIAEFGEVPANYIPIPTIHPLEKRAWLEPNGARFVELIDQSEATWRRYCRSTVSSIQLGLTRNGKTYV